MRNVGSRFVQAGRGRGRGVQYEDIGAASEGLGCCDWWFAVLVSRRTEEQRRIMCYRYMYLESFMFIIIIELLFDESLCCYFVFSSMSLLW